MTRYVDIERSPLVQAYAPLLTLAIPHIAHAAIRNRGTIGGSLGLADPAAELPACMLALGGRIALASPRGIRWIPAEAFFHGLYQTAREVDEVIVKVGLPLAGAGTVQAFDELARRHGDYAIVGVAAELTLGDDGRVQRARLALLGVGSHAILADNAAAAIQGRSLDDMAGAAAAAAIGADLQELESEAIDGLRRRLAGVLVERVLAQAARRANSC
jgi:carbon-monoxide dehydrogenase medium subunit